MIFPAPQGPPQVEAWQPFKTLSLTDFPTGIFECHFSKKNKGVSMSWETRFINFYDVKRRSDENKSANIYAFRRHE